MKDLFIDIECFSDIDLAKCGIYKYVESPNHQILLFGYSIDGNETQVVDLTNNEEIPTEIIDALLDESIIKWAFNSNFERINISSYLKKNGYKLDDDYLSPSSWKCHMVWSAYLGLPLSLKGVGEVLNLEEKKITEGKELIKFFCVPCNPTRTNDYRTRNLPIHDKEKWDKFKRYNKRDIDVEIAIHNRLKKYTVPDFVWDEYHDDQIINDRGIGLDMELVNNAISIDEIIRANLLKTMQNLTKTDNPNSVMQLKEWLNEQGVEVNSLGKKDLIELKNNVDDAQIKEVIELREQISKSSIKKYQAMQNACCNDGRAHGMFQFYGANRSGRFSGRLIQLQNLPQNHMSDLASARSLVKLGDIDALETIYSNVPSTLSELIRTAFIPKKGYKFIVSDFSAIEARVIAWYAKETWRIKAFKNNKDIYCESASQMFHVPVEKHGVNAQLRQKGKIAELALGYGGGVCALTQMGALEMGLNEEELQDLVNAWRNASPKITEFWWSVDKASKKAIEEKKPTYTHGLKFEYRSGMLFITLPSGRSLAYCKPKIEENKYGGTSITYEGIGATKKWERIETYGPKLVENIVQGTARDILCNSIKTLRNYRIVAHVHDELIIEVPLDENIENINELMAKTPSWCKDLCLKADGYECEFYKKD